MKITDLKKVDIHLVIWVVVSFVVLLPILSTRLVDDEGLFLLQANRLLSVPIKLPNVDYISPYPGGMIFYNAFWLSVFGDHLTSIRLGLLVLFVLWIPSVYWLSKQFVSTLYSHLATVLVLGSTVLLYPHCGANWYGLILGWFSWLLLFYRCFCKQDIEQTAGNKKTDWLCVLSGFLLGLCVLTKQTLAISTGMSLWAMLILATSERIKPSKEPMNPLNRYINMAALTFGFIITVVYFVRILLPEAFELPVVLLFILPLVWVLSFLFKVIQKNKAYIFNSGWLSDCLKALVSGFVVGFLTIPVFIFILRGADSMLLWFIRSYWYVPNILLGVFRQNMPLLVELTSVLGFFWCGALLSHYFLPDSLKNENRLMILVSSILLISAIFLFLSPALHLNPLNFIIYLSLPLIWSGILVSELKAVPTAVSAVFIMGLLLYFGTFPVYATPYFATCFAGLAIFAVVFLYRSFHGNTSYNVSIMMMLVVLLFGTVPQFKKNVKNYQQFSLASVIRHLTSTTNMEPADIEKELSGIVDFLRRHNERSDNVYVLSDSGAELYYLSGHDNPTIYDYHLLSKLSMGHEIIESLSRHQVQYIVVQPSEQSIIPLQPALKGFIHQNYHPFVQHDDYLVLQSNTLLKRETP